MRVTFIANKLNIDRGGSNRSLDLLAEHLSASNYRVKIVTINSKLNRLPSNRDYVVKEVPEEAVHTRLGEQIPKLKQAYRVMKDESRDTDIFHVFSPFLIPAAGLYARNHRRPVVVRLNSYKLFCTNHECMDGVCHKSCTVGKKFSHDDNPLQKKIIKLPIYFLKTFINPRLGGSVDRYFAQSPEVKRIYSEVGISPDKISVVPNFADPEFESQPLMGRDNNARLSSEFTALYVGRLKYAKGVDLLLKAMKRVESMKGVIVGEGGQARELRGLSEELGLSDRVNILGWVEHEKLSKYYNKADILVHPARWPDPLPRTVLESMQHGTPAVVSNVGGAAWLSGGCGKTFTSGNPEELARVIKRLIDNAGDLSEMQRACSARLQDFSPSKVLSRIESEYSDLLKSQ